MALPTILRLDPSIAWGDLAKKRLNQLMDLIVDASTTVIGLTRFATTAETTTGTAEDIAATPKDVKAVIDALKAAVNTWSAAQTISTGATATGLTLLSTAASGPAIDMKNTNTGSAGAEIPQINFYGKDDAGNDQLFAFIDAIIKTATNGAEDGRMRFITTAGGANGARITIEAGVQIGSPTGGDKGAGTLNLDNALYRDGTQVIGARITGYTNAMTGTADRATSYATGTITLVQLAERVKAIEDDLLTHGVIGV